MRTAPASLLRWLVPGCSALALLGLASCSSAQDGAWDESAAIELPRLWVGSNPVTLEDLKGKAALLYFYEESCPTCKKRWPEIQAAAAKYADKPIAFIAVNSGTPAPLVMRYAQSVGLAWPVIVDVDRSFEKACDVGEISLQNIARVRYITAEGEFCPGSSRELEETIERALEGAHWNVEPTEIPPELSSIWRGVEFGQFALAAKPLTKAVGSRKPEVKAAAEKLMGVVEAQAGAALAAAKALEQNDRIGAYKQYTAVAEKFNGYPAGTEAAAAARKLARDPAYRQELNDLKLVERQRASANSPKPAVRARATATIQKIIDEHPDSEAARLGREILSRQAVFEVK